MTVDRPIEAVSIADHQDGEPMQPEGGTTPPESGPRPRHRPILGPPALGALFVGLVFWTQSLRPTLLPHPPLAQGVVGALSLLIGYGLGGLVITVACAVAHRMSWSGASAQLRRAGRITFAVVGVLGVVFGPVIWFRWQNDQRKTLTMPSISWTECLMMLVVTAVVTLLFGVVARLVARGVAWVDRRLAQGIGPVLADIVTGILVVFVALSLGNKLVFDAFLAKANEAFAASDTTTDPEVVHPSVATVSGGPGSIIPWATLGLQGRNWVAGVTPTADLQRFAGPGVTVLSPIRAYAGLASADSVDARARLAVADLTRAGGFQRSVLVVATATGSGWINPVMSSALEYEWGGDTAMVSMQYSYLPSWIAFLTDSDKAAAAGEALNRAVNAAWSKLPTDHRPRLVFFGESLGSFGSEHAYASAGAAASVDATLSHTDATLWVGPTNGNPVWHQVTAARVSGSPVWRPTYGNGQRVRFANKGNELPASAPTAPVAVYLQHSSDPVTWWDVPTIWAPPEWLSQHPRGADVPSSAEWFPIVTWLQTTGDLIQGFSAPAGHGHNYNNDWAQALTSVATPARWTPTDTARLSIEMVNLHGLGGN